MSRRAERAARTEQARKAAVPAWVRTFDQAEWSEPDEDEDPRLLAGLAAAWGVKFARQVRAQARWSEACSEWCRDHGTTLKAARSPDGPP